MSHPQDEHIAPLKIKNDPKIANAIAVGADSRVSEFSSGPQGITTDHGQRVQDGFAILCFQLVQITKCPPGEEDLSHVEWPRAA